MNNWEVYKLLAHVRPPVSKVLAGSLPSPPPLSFSSRRATHGPHNLSLAISLPPLSFSAGTLTPCNDSLLAAPDTSPG